MTKKGEWIGMERQETETMKDYLAYLYKTQVISNQMYNGILSKFPEDTGTKKEFNLEESIDFAKRLAETKYITGQMAHSIVCRLISDYKERALDFKMESRDSENMKKPHKSGKRTGGYKQRFKNGELTALVKKGIENRLNSLKPLVNFVATQSGYKEEEVYGSVAACLTVGKEQGWLSKDENGMYVVLRGIDGGK